MSDASGYFLSGVTSDDVRDHAWPYHCNVRCIAVMTASGAPEYQPGWA